MLTAIDLTLLVSVGVSHALCFWCILYAVYRMPERLCFGGEE